jgi:hypothetical protein
LPDDPSTVQPDPDEPRAPQETPSGASSGVTESGYAYDVVREDELAAVAEPAPKRPPRKLAIAPWLLAAAVVVPAVVVGVVAWVLASMSGGGGDEARLDRNVTNVVNTFSQTGDGSTTSIRYEGELPPAFPDDVPKYPGADVISSVVQLQGDDASYIVVFDTKDSRQQVADYYGDALAQDPWQVEIEQAGRESSVFQFSNIEDADITGVVLAAESKDDEVTTIFMSIQAVGGASENEPNAFDPGENRPFPAGHDGRARLLSPAVPDQRLDGRGPARRNVVARRRRRVVVHKR